MAVLYLGQTDANDFASCGLFLSYSPTKIHIDKLHSALSAQVSDLGEDSLDKHVSLFLHIPERRGYEDANHPCVLLIRGDVAGLLSHLSAAAPSRAVLPLKLYYVEDLPAY